MPATSFSEYTWDSRRGVPYSFALGADGAPFAFAGCSQSWTGSATARTSERMLFSFLPTQANDVVRPVHREVILCSSPARNRTIGLRPTRLWRSRFNDRLGADGFVVVMTGQRRVAAA